MRLDIFSLILLLLTEQFLAYYDEKVPLEVMRNSKRCDLSFIPSHFIRCPSRLRAISVISVPDLALGDRAIYRARITCKNSKWRPQNTKHAR